MMISLLMPMLLSNPIHIEQQPLAYIERLESRTADHIRLLVIHATETPDLSMARELAEEIHYQQSRTGNSGHFYIDRNGRIFQYVPIERVAHHVSGYNSSSIGIELVNTGRYPNWFDSRHQAWLENYPEAQINGLRQLIKHLQQQLPRLARIARHSDLDQRLIAAADNSNIRIHRKLDPGVLFPWGNVVKMTGLKPLSVSSDTAADRE